MLTVLYEDENGDEIALELPYKMEVCWDCGGTGYVLREGLRGATYTHDEFMESFSEDEDREAYFRPGSHYDTQCETCHGNNVMPVIDEEHIPENLKEQYEEYCDYVERQGRADANYAAERAAERRAGC